VRISHRVPKQAWQSKAAVEAVVSAEYQAEVDASTQRAQVAYEAALRRVEAAERRAAKARERLDHAASKRSRDAASHALVVATALVELRRAELEKCARMMTACPAAAAHRGRKSFRPVPGPGSVIDA